MTVASHFTKAAAVLLMLITTAFACPEGQYESPLGLCLPKIEGQAGQNLERQIQAVGRALARADIRLVPVRAYLKNEAIPPAGVGAYGIVVLRGRPTEATRSRLLMLCKAFTSYLPRVEAIPNSIPVSDQMMTVWPLDKPDAEEASSDNCDFVIDHYEIFAGDAAIADAKKQGASFDGDGPYLVGWSPSESRGDPGKLVLVIDMSGLQSQDSFDKQILLWKEKIVEDPVLWRTGFSTERWLLVLRDFADRYGESILDAVRFSKR